MLGAEDVSLWLDLSGNECNVKLGRSSREKSQNFARSSLFPFTPNKRSVARAPLEIPGMKSKSLNSAEITENWKLPSRYNVKDCLP